MNNGFMFNPIPEFYNNQNLLINYNKLINKVERLEKDIRILENRLNIIEKKDIKLNPQEELSDMYMI